MFDNITSTTCNLGHLVLVSKRCWDFGYPCPGLDMNRLSISWYEVQELTYHQDADLACCSPERIRFYQCRSHRPMIVESILIHPLGLFNQFARGIGKVQYGTAEYSKQMYCYWVIMAYVYYAHDIMRTMWIPVASVDTTTRLHTLLHHYAIVKLSKERLMSVCEVPILQWNNWRKAGTVPETKEVKFDLPHHMKDGGWRRRFSFSDDPLVGAMLISRIVDCWFLSSHTPDQIISMNM